MIRLNHVSKIYGDGSKKAVDDLSWDIEDGRSPDLSAEPGKTTTLKMITGILAPSEERLRSMEKISRRIRSKPEAPVRFYAPDDPDAFAASRNDIWCPWQISAVSDERQRFIRRNRKTL